MCLCVLGACDKAFNCLAVPVAMATVSDSDRTWCICVCVPLFTPLTFLVGYSALCTSHGVSLFECVKLLQSFRSLEVKDVRVIVEGELLSSLAVADNVSKQGQQEHTAVLEGLAGLSDCR